jgi:5-methylcytosine-specific restriction endonuclease McrA
MVPVRCGNGRLFTITLKRKHIASELRELVMERDRHSCVLCGATEDLTLDHIHPWSKGGPDTYENLRVLCRPCNSRKHDK